MRPRHWTLLSILLTCTICSAEDLAPTGTTLYGAWARGALGNYDYAAPGKGEAWCDWTFDVPAGFYEVVATYVPHSNRATNAGYKVVTTGYSASFVRVDQRKGASATLGSIAVRTNGAVTVRLTNDADGYVIAQRVTLRPLEPTGTATAWWVRDKEEVGLGDQAPWYRGIIGEEPPVFPVADNWLCWQPAAGGTLFYEGEVPIAGLPVLEAGGGPVECEVLVRVKE